MALFNWVGQITPQNHIKEIFITSNRFLSSALFFFKLSPKSCSNNSYSHLFETVSWRDFWEGSVKTWKHLESSTGAWREPWPARKLNLKYWSFHSQKLVIHSLDISNFVEYIYGKLILQNCWQNQIPNNKLRYFPGSRQLIDQRQGKRK